MKAQRLIATLVALLLSSVALAEDKNNNASIADGGIAPQALDTALEEFAERSGLQVIYLADVAKGKQSPGAEPDLSYQATLDQLLSSTDLEYEFLNDNTVTLQAVAEEGGDSDSGNASPAPIPMVRATASQAQTTVSQSDENAREAQEEESIVPLEEIIVTGTNIRGVENPTTPVLTFDREAIERSGAFTLEGFLRTVPQNFNSTTPINADSGNPFSAGNLNVTQGTSVDLRGLGAGSTLTLLNGRRMTASGAGSFVDVSVLPLDAIERVDIQTDGASAVYGSDAVGGVVNFITRRDYEGFEISTRYGTVTDGSREEIGVGAAGGHAWSTGNFSLGANYLETEPLLSSERDFIDVSVSNPNGTLGPETEKFSLFSSLSQNLTSRLSIGVDALFTTRETNNTTNTGLQLSFESEQEALFLNGRLDYQINDQLNASFFADYSQEELSRSSTLLDPPEIDDISNDQLTLEASLSGQLIELPAGELSFALGTQYREESYDTSFEAFATDPERDVNAVYGEILVPLVSSEMAVPLVERLELSLAGRYEDYSDLGETTNPKVGVFWAFSEHFSARATYSESFRAPTLREFLDVPSVFVSPFPSFLFTAVEPPAQDDRLAPGTVATLFISGGGGPLLKEETAEVYSAGFDYTPSAIPSLKLSATYYNVSYTDRIEGISPLDPIQSPEFGSLVSSPADIGFVNTLFELAASGQANLVNATPIADLTPEDVQVAIRSGTQNVATRDTSGLDLNVNYDVDSDLGKFSTGANATFQFDYKSKLTDDTPEVDQISTLYRPVDFRLRGNIGWQRDGFSSFIILNYVDGYRDNPDEIISNDIGSWTTVDLSFAYDFNERFDGTFLDGATASVSVQNVFDEDPPFVSTTIDGLSYDPANADPFGRFVSFNVRKQF